jgi:hypothetical protein
MFDDLPVSSESGNEAWGRRRRIHQRLQKNFPIPTRPSDYLMVPDNLLRIVDQHVDHVISESKTLQFGGALEHGFQFRTDSGFQPFPLYALLISARRWTCTWHVTISQVKTHLGGLDIDDVRQSAGHEECKAICRTFQDAR